ncbi:PDZ domain-containing protein [Qipengyuania sp. NPDC077563]|uniref:PDZ domain-containing protein n=1 Tax=Qipengyuania sp. NPDC077563 TaxID=3364497 RepID=UPI00384EB166
MILPALVLIAACNPAMGGPGRASAPLASPLKTFQDKEVRLYEIGYRLASANAPYCERTEPTLGFLIHDAGAYDDDNRVREEFGLVGDIGVQAVAPYSPASDAGIKINDTIIAIDGQPVASFQRDPEETWRRALDIRRKISASASSGSVPVEWSSSDTGVQRADLEVAKVCKSQVELLSKSDSALADGTRILVGDRFPGLAYSDDELAAVLAHEMAHNVLNHIEFLVENGRSGNRGRNSERDADRLMPWLLANAGYDPGAATRMMQRYGPRHSGGIFRSRSHDGWDERVSLIQTQVQAVNRIRSHTGDARVDWRIHFKPLLKEI